MTEGIRKAFYLLLDELGEAIANGNYTTAGLLIDALEALNEIGINNQNPKDFFAEFDCN